MRSPVAAELRVWLKDVLQHAEPYMSDLDIDKGNLWYMNLLKMLREAGFGILRVTPKNRQSRWLHFEAGALSMLADGERVAPVLFRVDKSELIAPLAQMQVTPCERAEMLKLVHSINRASVRPPTPPPLDDARLERSFNQWWPKLETQLKALAVDDADDTSGPAPAERRGDSAGNARVRHRNPEDAPRPGYTAP
ncbi:MAG TPA: hypothetical protein VLJ59_17205 [Mycobacteriales bacterium]|nr:hypothetical protein [Mycobacteriales bacterium]